MTSKDGRPIANIELYLRTYHMNPTTMLGFSTEGRTDASRITPALDYNERATLKTADDLKKHLCADNTVAMPEFFDEGIADFISCTAIFHRDADRQRYTRSEWAFVDKRGGGCELKSLGLFRSREYDVKLRKLTYSWADSFVEKGFLAAQRHNSSGAGAFENINDAAESLELERVP